MAIRLTLTILNPKACLLSVESISAIPCVCFSAPHSEARRLVSACVHFMCTLFHLLTPPYASVDVGSMLRSFQDALLGPGACLREGTTPRSCRATLVQSDQLTNAPLLHHSNHQRLTAPDAARNLPPSATALRTLSPRQVGNVGFSRGDSGGGLLGAGHHRAVRYVRQVERVAGREVWILSGVRA